MIVLSGLLWAAAAWAWTRGHGDARIVAEHAPRASARSSPWSTARARTAVAALVALACVLLLGLPVGPAAGMVAVLVLPRWLARLEPAATRRRREALAAQGPLVADLLAATLASGAGVRDSVRAVAAAVGEPARSALRPVVLALDLGADAADAWRLVDDSDTLEPVTTAVIRAERSGAALSGSLAAVGDDLRREQRREVDVAARSAAVRAVAPLAACFLPAFLLLGVVPVVVALATTVVDGAPG